jgi:hypothetical protein
MSIDINRRAIVAGAAALPAVSLTAIAAPSAADPIFATIEAYRKADDAFIARARFEDDLAEVGKQPLRRRESRDERCRIHEHTWWRPVGRTLPPS